MLRNRAGEPDKKGAALFFGRPFCIRENKKVYMKDQKTCLKLSGRSFPVCRM